MVFGENWSHTEVGSTHLSAELTNGNCIRRWTVAEMVLILDTVICHCHSLHSILSVSPFEVDVILQELAFEFIWAVIETFFRFLRKEAGFCFGSILASFAELNRAYRLGDSDTLRNNSLLPFLLHNTVLSLRWSWNRTRCLPNSDCKVRLADLLFCQEDFIYIWLLHRRCLILNLWASLVITVIATKIKMAWPQIFLSCLDLFLDFSLVNNYSVNTAWLLQLCARLVIWSHVNHPQPNRMAMRIGHTNILYRLGLIIALK
jgi:hypothetical protein